MSSPSKIIIGRERSCDIALADGTVSARHAEISFLPEGKLLLTDCKSRNGTFRILPNGSEQRVHQELVSPLDRVRFGDVALGMREILEVVRLKQPVPAVPDKSEEPAWAKGRKLERCDCGVVKVAGTACPECGR